MEIKGRIKHIGQTESFGSNNFEKRLLLIETENKYPQLIPIDFVQDRVDLPDPYKVGQIVTVSINLRGSEYNGKYYVSVQGWKITSNEPTTTQTTAIKPNEDFANDF